MSDPRQVTFMEQPSMMQYTSHLYPNGAPMPPQPGCGVGGHGGYMVTPMPQPTACPQFQPALPPAVQPKEKSGKKTAILTLGAAAAVGVAGYMAYNSKFADELDSKSVIETGYENVMLQTASAKPVPFSRFSLNLGSRKDKQPWGFYKRADFYPDNADTILYLVGGGSSVVSKMPDLTSVSKDLNANIIALNYSDASGSTDMYQAIKSIKDEGAELLSAIKSTFMSNSPSTKIILMAEGHSAGLAIDLAAVPDNAAAVSAIVLKDPHATKTPMECRLPGSAYYGFLVPDFILDYFRKPADSVLKSIKTVKSPTFVVGDHDPAASETFFRKSGAGDKTLSVGFGKREAVKNLCKAFLEKVTHGERTGANVVVAVDEGHDHEDHVHEE